ncbi:MAG: ankyrin repeat domain-containing protein [Pseudomonadota bacterium]
MRFSLLNPFATKTTTLISASQISDEDMALYLSRYASLQRILDFFPDRKERYRFATRKFTATKIDAKTGQKTETEYSSALDYVLKNCANEPGFYEMVNLLCRITTKQDTFHKAADFLSETLKEENAKIRFNYKKSPAKIKREKIGELKSKVSALEKILKNNPSDRTPLHSAGIKLEDVLLLIKLEDTLFIRIINENILKEMFQIGIQADQKVDDVMLLFHVFVINGRTDLVELFANKFPTMVNAAVNDGYTALLIAIQEGYFDIVKYLVKNFPIDEAVKKNAFLIAMEEDNFELFKYLLETPGFIDINLAFTSAIMNKKITFVRYIVENHRDKINSNTEDTLHVSVYSGSLDIVKYLTETGIVDIKEHPTGLMKPLDSAILMRHLSIVDYLIAAGIETNIESAINNAASAGPEYFKYFAENYLIKSLEKRRSMITLHYAVAGGNLTTVQMLLKNGADKDMPDGNGATPLYIAAQNNNLEIFRFLMAQGANKNLGQNQFTALEGSIISQSFGIAIILLDDTKPEEMTSEFQTKLLKSVFRSDSTEFTEYFLTRYESILSPESITKSIHETFQEASGGKNYLAIFKMLFKDQNFGLDINSADENGLTILHRAISNNDFALVNFCLELGANIEIQNNLGIDAVGLITASTDSRISHLIKTQKAFLDFKLQIEQFFKDKPSVTFQELKNGNIFVMKVKIKDEEKEVSFPKDISLLLIEQNLQKQFPKQAKASKTSNSKLDNPIESINQLAQQISAQQSTLVLPREGLTSKTVEEAIGKIKTTFKEWDTKHKQSKAKDSLLTIKDLIDQLSGQPTENLQQEILFIKRCLTNLKFLNKSKTKDATVHYLVLPNLLQTEESIQEAKEKEAAEKDEQEVEKFIGQIHSLVLNLLSCTTQSLLEKSPDEKPEELEKHRTSLTSLKQIWSARKMLIFTPRSTVSSALATGLEQQFYLPNQETKGKDLAKIFLEHNLQKYNDEQIEIICDNIGNLEVEEQAQFLRVGAINLVKSPNLELGFLNIQKLIKAIAPEKVESFRENLYEAYNQFGNQDLDNIAKFLVVVEDLFGDEILSQEEIDQKLQETKQNLVESEQSDEDEIGFAQNVEHRRDPVMKNLYDLKSAKKFSTILSSSTLHAKQKHNPRLKLTKVEKVKINLATTVVELKGKLGDDINIDQPLLDRIVDALASDFFTDINIKKRGATTGAHNIGFKIPKILPNKISPLSDHEKKFYRDNLEELKLALQATRPAR